MKTINTLIFFLLAFLVSLNSLLLAQEERTEEVTLETAAQQSEKTRGGDENIIEDSFVNDEENLSEAPVERGGEKARGTGFSTKIKVENWTAYTINIYANGAYKTTVAPWSDSYFWQYGSSIKLYGKAPLKNGNYKYWGPQQRNISSYKNFRWKLTY